MSERRIAARGLLDANGRPKKIKVSPARIVAFETLKTVETDGAYANLALPQVLAKAELSVRDAALATEIVYGTLRNLSRIDWVLEQCMPRKISEVDASVRVVLRLTAHQILHMRVPDHAAVAEAVELTKYVAGFGVEKFVNGVARAIVDHTPGEWDRRMQSIENKVERVAVQYSHPQWIVRAFAQALVAHGRPAKELKTLLAADNANPQVMLCARPGQILPGELADAVDRYIGVEPTPSVYSEWGVAIPHGDPGRLHAVRDGRAAVQDEGSQLVASALAEYPVEEENQSWLDMCAGPGGKAGLLAAYAALDGINLLANEVTPHRAKLVEQTIRGFDNVEVVVGDGREISKHGKFTKIMLDAPCTGLGSLRRRPESRWNRQPSDVRNLCELQAQLLDAGVEALEVGGVLAYVTCSPHEAETNAQIERIALRADVEILDTAAAVAAVTMEEIELTPTPIGGGNTIQLWPHVHGTDAMFLCLLRKVK